ncbi:hypothetical protein [Actinocorallia longicatena]|uniref:Lipoprotein n=1 Tax=Actinocorallia longicatena TaxID=111803 RepID=A0ABP6QJ21_9ACTN
MVRNSLIAAVATAGVLALTGCEVSIGSDSAKPTETAAPAATSAPSAAPSGSATAAAPPKAGVFATAKDAADALVAAWHLGDKTQALKAAGPNTVEKVFASAISDDKIQACRAGSEAGVSYAYDCYYAWKDGTTSHFYVDPYPATGWRVVNYQQILK